MSLDGLTTVGTCLQCSTPRIVLFHVEHRTRYGNGHRAKTEKAPLCGPCALDLAHRYDLMAEVELMGKSYFVEGWNAESLLWAADLEGEHS